MKWVPLARDIFFPLQRPNSWTKSRQKSSEFSSLLFTSTALPWDFYFFKLKQPLTVSTVQCCYFTLSRRKEENHTIPSSLWKKSIQKPQVRELSRLCPETSTKLYGHEFGFKRDRKLFKLPQWHRRHQWGKVLNHTKTSAKFVVAVYEISERFVVDIVNLLPFSTTPAKINNPATPSLINKFFLLKYNCRVYKLRIYTLCILLL